MCSTACLTHHDQSMSNLVCSHYPKFRNFQERTEKYTSLQYYHFSRGNGTCFTTTSKKASENEPLTTVLPCQKGTLRVKGWSSVSRRGFLCTHDHALLTKNFRARALVKINKSFLKSARSAHTTELATCNAHANLRRPARPPGF